MAIYGSRFERAALKVSKPFTPLHQSHIPKALVYCAPSLETGESFHMRWGYYSVQGSTCPWRYEPTNSEERRQDIHSHPGHILKDAGSSGRSMVAEGEGKKNRGESREQCFSMLILGCFSRSLPGKCRDSPGPVCFSSSPTSVRTPEL